MLYSFLVVLATHQKSVFAIFNGQTYQNSTYLFSSSLITIILQTTGYMLTKILLSKYPKQRNIQNENENFRCVRDGAVTTEKPKPMIDNDLVERQLWSR